MAMRSPQPCLFPAYPQADFQHHASQITAAVRRVSQSGRYILGPEVEAFEREFAHYLGVDHVVGVASGTDAIEIMLRALGITQGMKVVVPSLTAVAVAAGVTRAGAELALAECEPETLTMCPHSLRRLLQSPDGHRIKAALVVHLYGQPAHWERLQEVADEHGILLLEDAAQAHGALWQGRRVGTLGRAAAFSFYPTKNLGAMGDAGAIVTQDADLAERVRLIRQYGWKTRQISECGGVNSRLDELQAAILRGEAALIRVPASQAGCPGCDLCRPLGWGDAAQDAEGLPACLASARGAQCESRRVAAPSAIARHPRRCSLRLRHSPAASVCHRAVFAGHRKGGEGNPHLAAASLPVP